jgi:hypothetical protein
VPDKDLHLLWVSGPISRIYKRNRATVQTKTSVPRGPGLAFCHYLKRRSFIRGDRWSTVLKTGCKFIKQGLGFFYGSGHQDQVVRKGQHLQTLPTKWKTLLMLIQAAEDRSRTRLNRRGDNGSPCLTPLRTTRGMLSGSTTVLSEYMLRISLAAC